MNYYRHGDILLKPLKKLPKQLKKISEDSQFVLAEGETTGHKHLLIAEPNTLEILQDEGGKYYIKLNKDARLTHEEHKLLIIKKGLYIVERETEFDYFLDTIRRVSD